jgi:hypothetical protein
MHVTGEASAEQKEKPSHRAAVGPDFAPREWAPPKDTPGEEQVEGQVVQGICDACVVSEALGV